MHPDTLTRIIKVSNDTYASCSAKDNKIKVWTFKNNKIKPQTELRGHTSTVLDIICKFILFNYFSKDMKFTFSF